MRLSGGREVGESVLRGDGAAFEEGLEGSSEASSSKLSLRRATLLSAVMSRIRFGFWWYETFTRTTWPLSASAASNFQVNTVTAQADESPSSSDTPAPRSEARRNDDPHRAPLWHSLPAGVRKEVN